jgi:hypothetical protein
MREFREDDDVTQTPPAAAGSPARRFFGTFIDASDTLNRDALNACFADPFLFADASGSRPVSRDAFLEALPRRAKMFADAGLGRAVLTSLDETRLDPHYILVRTEWTTPRTDGGTPVRLVSSYLLHDDDAELRIVLYLNHEGLPQAAAPAAAPAPSTA